MPTGSIILPADGVGPRVADNKVVEDTVTKAVARYRPENTRIPDGSYSVAFPTKQVIATTQGAGGGSGNGVIFNPVANNRWAVIKRIQVFIGKTVSSIRLTAPRMLVEKFSNSVTLTGTELVVAKLRSTELAHSMNVQEVATGIAATNVVPLLGFFPVVQMTTASSPPGNTGTVATWIDFADDEAPVLAPGEGMRFLRQVETGDATDQQRHMQVTVWWNEFTTEF